MIQEGIFAPSDPIPLMQNLNFRLLIIFLVAAIGFQSCETEIDISAPYKRIPVIYGLLDLSADTQFVMINRTFLGAGNADDFAQIEDSMIYDNVDARIYYGSGENDFVQLDSIRVTDKDLGGVFYAPTQRVYYVPTAAFPSNIWNATTNFELRVAADGDDITASTQLVDVSDAHLSKLIPSTNAAQAISFVGTTGGYVSSFKFEWRAFKHAVKHEAFILFDYTEQRADGSSVPKTLRIPFALSDASAPDVNFDFNFFSKNGEFFYNYLENNIPVDGAVVRRAFGSLHFVINAAGTDFSTYLNVGDPVSSVGQDRPRYSNINGGEGIGIFSSRGLYTYEKQMKVNSSTPQTIIELVTGVHTQNFCFCDPEPGSTYSCNTVCQ